jgi:glycine cleavage system H lipoate-binding protein
MKTREKQTIKGFQVLENECIWMKAGVINFKTCDLAYDCSHCAFDKGMRRSMGKGHRGAAEEIAPEWVKHLQKKYRGADMPCRHRLTGRVDAPKICILNYECYHCAYDQMLDDMDVYQLAHQPQTFLAGGYSLARDYYYHMGHSWVRIEHGGRGRVGLDDFAVSLFGPSQHIDLPPLGAMVEQDRIGWAFKCENREAAVLAPITGTVLAVNHGAQEHPEILHADPYHAGWLFMVEPDRTKKDLKKLYFGEQSRRWMETEGQHLLGMMGPEYEKLAATGGRAVRNVIGNFPELDWNDLVRQFLRTETHMNAS